MKPPHDSTGRPRVPLVLLIALLGLTSVGCKTVQTFQFKPSTNTLTKHPLSVALVVENDFCQLEQRRDPEGYVYPLGAYLCPCVRHLAQGAFTKVSEFNSLDAALKSTDADVVLAPKFVKLEIRARGVAWEKRHALVVLEWTLKGTKDQRTVWLATVEGRAEGTVGTAFSMDKKDRETLQQALDDLHRSSIRAFNESDEIRAFVQSHGRR